MEIYWLWFSMLPGVGPQVQKKLLQRFGSPVDIYHAGAGELKGVEGLGKKRLQQVLAARSLDGAARVLEQVERVGARLLLYSDPLYPEMVKELADAPLVLFYRGKLQAGSCGVGVVGARRCTAYGKEVAREAATFLAKKKIPVISGMARGIDGYANTACLQAGGYTLAFLGHGVDLCSPADHRDLMAAITENGAVISEYPPGTESRPEFFPRRNFLISAWSYRLLVVEAAPKSGSLITARLSREMGRPVLAVPGGIYSRESKGTNELIASGKAHIYTELQQLLPERTTDSIKENKREKAEAAAAAQKGGAAEPTLPCTDNLLPLNENKNELTTGTDTGAPTLPEQQIVTLLQTAGVPCSQEELAAQFAGEKKKFWETLALMELEGTVENLPGGRVRLLQSPC